MQDVIVQRRVGAGSGRTRDDDSGERFPLTQSAPAECLGIGTFTEVWRSETLERARRGHVAFSVDVRAAIHGLPFRLSLEVNVIGYVQGFGQLVLYTTIDHNNPGEYEWSEPETFSALAMEVRQNINGVNSDATTQLLAVRLNVAGAYWR